MNQEDPHLARLLVDGNEIDTATLSGALEGIAGIDRASGDPVLLPGYDLLNAQQKLVALNMAVLAAHLLGLRPGSATAVADLVRMSGLARGTVAPTLRVLVTERRLLAQDEDRRYQLNQARLNQAAALLRGVQSESAKHRA